MESDMTSDDNSVQQNIREELSSMSLAEILKMKEELGAKVYNEAVLGVKPVEKKQVIKKCKEDLKRLNKNCPREMFAKRQVPFLGDELRKSVKLLKNVRDPRFDRNAGEFKMQHFKEDYKFIADIRENEISEMRKKLRNSNEVNKEVIKLEMQKLINKNIEERKWHSRQNKLKEEKEDIQRSLNANEKPHFLTKKEKRVKDLVEQFEELKKSGRLQKHIEKRRKKNAAKDRKKISLN